MAKVVKIANPVYDTYFKLLMQDLRIAKFLIGTIIGEEIVEVHPYPNERVKIKVNEKVPRLMRFDYSAKVKTKEGELKLIAVEVQKAYDILDVMRFRRYLAQMLEKEEELTVKNKRGKPKTVKNPLPVIGIYFLGRPFEEVGNNCIKLDHDLTDMQTGEKITQRISFIERLMPKGFFIVFENLHLSLKTALGRLLSIFVQDDFVVIGGKEIKYLREYKAQTDDPEILHIISILQAATGNIKLVKAVEEEEASERFVRLLLEEEREKADIAEKKAEIAEKKSAKDRKLKKEAEAKAEEAEAKAEEERKQKKEAEAKAEEAEKKASVLNIRLTSAAKKLYLTGQTHESIAETLDISVEEVKNILAEGEHDFRQEI
jgi:hypothetical protein